MYEDIAGMYVEIHEAHIRPGLVIVDKMGQRDGRTTDEKQGDLNVYAIKSQEGIKETVDKVSTYLPVDMPF